MKKLKEAIEKIWKTVENFILKQFLFIVTILQVVPKSFF